MLRSTCSSQQTTRGQHWFSSQRKERVDWRRIILINIKGRTGQKRRGRERAIYRGHTGVRGHSSKNQRKKEYDLVNRGEKKKANEGVGGKWDVWKTRLVIVQHVGLDRWNRMMIKIITTLIGMDRDVGKQGMICACAWEPELISHTRFRTWYLQWRIKGSFPGRTHPFWLWNVLLFLHTSSLGTS